MSKPYLHRWNVETIAPTRWGATFGWWPLMFAVWWDRRLRFDRIRRTGPKP